MIEIIRRNGSYAGTGVIKYPFKIIHHELQIENCRFYDLRGSYYISSTIEDIQKASAVLENIIQSDITNKIINFEKFVKKVE